MVSIKKILSIDKRGVNLRVEKMLRTLFILVITHAILSSAQEVSDDDIQKFADANNKLAGSLYPRLINGNSNNVVFCPASLMTGLGIMLYGARGNTQKELHSVLGYKAAGLSNDKVPSAFHNIFTIQLPEDGLDTVNYTLNCADEIMVKKSAPLDETYKNEVDDQYVATVKNADFENDAQNVTRSINHFVNTSTFGKIKKIVNSVSPSTSALSIDAVYFKGKWATPFPSGLTSTQLFYSTQLFGQQYVPFMQISCDFPYTESDGYQAAFLPYIGNNVGLLVILPTQRYGLSALENTMTPDKIVEVLNQLEPTKIKVSLPKFNVKYFRDFTNDFWQLGARSAYDGSGDFSGMTSNKNLVVTGPYHKVRMEVDEGEQSVSAPVTQGDYKSFTADHPFMLSVVDRRDNMLFFLGRITSL